MDPAKLSRNNSRESTGPYPQPEVSIRPVLSFSSFFGNKECSVPTVNVDGRAFWVTSGRIATALGLQLKGIGEGDEVLVPAYYCTTMFDAIAAVGATPIFYKSLADLAMDQDDVRSKISNKTKALIAVHFFGFPQAMNDIMQLCRESELVLVEDCAHAYFGQYDGMPLGSFGDFTIASAMKFFPISDGGALIFPPGKEVAIALHSAGIGFEAKSIVNDIERSIRYGRFQPFTTLLRIPIVLKDWIWSTMKSISRSSARIRSDERVGMVKSLGPDSSYGGFGFDPAWMHVRMSWFSRWLVDSLPRARMVVNRRQNFNRLLKAFTSVENARPLYSELPEDVVPYAFPLQVSNVDVVFSVLKRAGIPILRWEDVDESACDVSTRYSKELLQLPCHQDVSEKELDWMIDRIKSILSEHA